MPMRGELPTVAARSYVRASRVEAGWRRFVAVISNPELRAVVAFCTIGFLITVNIVLRFPDFGGTVAQLASFP
jgi:esterase/lipase superfamily enzyme